MIGSVGVARYVAPLPGSLANKNELVLLVFWDVRFYLMTHGAKSRESRADGLLGLASLRSDSWS